MLVRWIYKPSAERHLIGEVEDIADEVYARELIRTARVVPVEPGPEPEGNAGDAVVDLPAATPEPTDEPAPPKRRKGSAE